MYKDLPTMYEKVPLYTTDRTVQDPFADRPTRSSHDCSWWDKCEPFMLKVDDKLLDSYRKLLPKQIPQIKNVIFNDPATIIFWMDGSKTVVKCMQGYEFDAYTGFMAAVCKKLFGSSSAVRKIVHSYQKQCQKEEEE